MIFNQAVQLFRRDWYKVLLEKQHCLTVTCSGLMPEVATPNRQIDIGYARLIQTSTDM